MEAQEAWYASLVTHKADPYASVREEAAAFTDEHPGAPAPPTFAEARMLATITRALRSSYVLLVGAAGGYAALHISSAFGHTGQLDAIEPDTRLGQLAETAVTRHAMSDRVRVHTGVARELIPSFNGPYDLAVLLAASVDRDWPGLHPDLVRLVRIGGSIVVSGVPSSLPAGESQHPLAGYLEQLANDERLLLGIAAGAGLALAARVR